MDARRPETFACAGTGPAKYRDGCLRGGSGPMIFWPSATAAPGAPAAARPGEPTHVLSDAGGGGFSVGTLGAPDEKFHPTRAVGTNGSFATAGDVAFSADEGRLVFASGWGREAAGWGLAAAVHPAAEQQQELEPEIHRVDPEFGST